MLHGQHTFIACGSEVFVQPKPQIEEKKHHIEFLCFLTHNLKHDCLIMLRK